MSGSRTAMPPRQPSGTSAQDTEMVFCHECENEWYRNQHGLQCPRCHSDFTEILENEASDPREDRYNPYEVEYDSDEDHQSSHDHEHQRHHHHHANPGGHGFTLRIGGEAMPSLSFQTVRSGFGSNGNPSPFGSRGPPMGSFGSNPRDPFTSSFTGPTTPPTRSHEPSPLPDATRRPPGATANYGNGGSPFADMFTSVLQNFVGGNGQLRNGPGQVPPLGGDGRSPGEPPHPPGMHQHEGLGSSGPGTPGTPMGTNERNPFVMNFPRGRGGVTFYSSTRTYAGPNGQVRTVRTSSPMPPGPTMPGQGGPGMGPGQQPGMQGEQPLDIADILANIIAASSQGQDNAQGLPPFFRAFGLGHGASGDYAYTNQDMERILSQLMEQHQGNAPPPASEDRIKNLPKVKVTQAEVDEKNECVVCQDEFTVDEEVVKLPCKHIYHEECVKRWLESHDACPICRTPITPEEERRQRPTPGMPPSGSGPSQQPGGSGPNIGPAGNAHTTSGSGGGNGARWTWSASFGNS